jgi:hypothetical protein
VTTNVTQIFGKALLPVTAAIKDPQPVFTAVGVDAFTGREWLAGELDRFLAANPCGYVFVEAEAGLGKTAFAAWLVKTRGYLSHFSRYSGGASVPLALGNLSAQLITKFDMKDVAPGGMLPEWAQTPGGFESLLTDAAARAGQGRQCPLVLVVDGMDEADTPREGLPWGLPLLLSDGVFVVGTYRTGRSPRRPDAPVVTLVITKEDQRNQDDIKEYLAKAVGEEVLAARLADAAVDPAEFTALLAARCAGVWVYLRYVLNELRLGLRSPDGISDLPVGLREYYADQIRRWKSDPGWHDGLPALLATLGVAEEALPAAALARLAGSLDPVVVQRWCDLTIRPFLTTTRTPPSGTPLRYEIYHASFRELLNPRHDEALAAPSDPQPYELLALADELKQAALSAQNRVCDTYLACFGGLDTGLPTLTANPSVAEIDGGYPLRHLAHHLCSAGRAPELHALLAAEHPAGPDRAVNTWFAAHEHADSIVSYLDDLARAGRDSAASTDGELSRRRPAPSLGLEIRYALMAASITSLAASISADLLSQLIRSGVWSLQRGLDHVRRIADPGERLTALLALRSQLNADDQASIMTEALAAATTISDNFSRELALARLGQFLPPGLLGQALTAATAITHDDAQARALTRLAPHLPADLLGQALTAATAMTSDFARSRAFFGLAPYLPPDLLGKALTAATAIADDSARAFALAGLTPYVAPGDRAVMAEAQASATAITDHYARAVALARLALHMPADARAAVMVMALAAASAITEEPLRADALAELGPRLPPELLSQALAAATAITDDINQARVLERLAPYLSPELLSQALTAAKAISSDYGRATALAGLGPRLPQELLSQALAAATAITGDYYARAEALAGLAPYVAGGEQAEILAEALAAATAIPLEHTRAYQLARLGPYLPPSLLSQALAAARAITGDSARSQALAGLAPYAAAGEQATVMAEALAAATAITDDNARCVALAGLAPYAAAGEQATVMAEALAAATAITDDDARARALAGLGPDLTADLLSQALATATAMLDDTARAVALAGLAPHVAADKQATVIAEALAAATAITDASAHAQILAGLAPYVAAEKQATVMAEALAAATAITDDYPRSRALAKLGRHLTRAQLSQALTVANAITEGDFRADALAGLGPYLPADLLSHARAAATAITDDYDRSRALAALAPYMAAGEQATVMAEALAAATAVTDDYDRSRALAALTPYMTGEQQRTVISEALAAALAITDDDYARALALAALGPYLPPDLLSQALAAAVAITFDDYARASALSKLAPYLTPDLLTRAMGIAPKVLPDTLTTILERGRVLLLPDGNTAYAYLLRDSLTGGERDVCFYVIAAAAPTVAQLGGLPAIEHCLKAIRDVHRWWP